MHTYLCSVTYMSVACITNVCECSNISTADLCVSRDLYWECHYNVLDYVPDLQEPTDSMLKEYKLPEKIEQFIEEKRYDNMERTITKVGRWEELKVDVFCLCVCYIFQHASTTAPFLYPCRRTT